MIIRFQFPRFVSCAAASFIEMLGSLAVVGVFAHLAISSINSMVNFNGMINLESDVSALNEAATSYLKNGGSLDGDLTLSEMVDRLSHAQGPPTEEDVFFSGASAIIPIMQSAAEADSNQLRVRWNPLIKAFEVAQSGAPGAKAFRRATPSDHARRTAMPMPSVPQSAESDRDRREQELYAPYQSASGTD